MRKSVLIWWLTVGGIFLLWCRPAPAARSIQPAVVASLERIFPPEEGYYVGLPLGSSGSTPGESESLVESYRVVVGDPYRIYEAIQRFGFEASEFRILEYEAALRTAWTSGVPGYRGIRIRALYQGKQVGLQILTVNMDRWLLWARDHYFSSLKGKKSDSVKRYAIKLSDFLSRRENALDATLPSYLDDGLKPSFRFMADSVESMESVGGDPDEKAGNPGQSGTPGKSTESRDCRDALDRNRAIRYKMFKGKEQVDVERKDADWLIRHRPGNPLPFHDDYRMQRLYQDFLDAGGDLHQIGALSLDVFADLPEGTYRFAVDELGRVRFAGVTGPDSVAPAHAILFPGEKVLAAGRFTVSGESGEGPAPGRKRISSIDMESQDFFFRCGAKHFERDLKKSSDQVFFRVGHLLAALDRLQIPYQGAALRKF